MNRKLLLAAVLLLGSMPAMSWFGGPASKIQMVTFFPVPYVSYSRVQVQKQMDVGLTSNFCQMTLGCAELPAGHSALVADIVNLQPMSKLYLNGGAKIVGNEVYIGQNQGPAGMVFNYLRVTDVNGAVSLNTKYWLSIENQLTLFGKEFPACNKFGSGTMEWQLLALDPDDTDKKETYLVCK